jgi:hypothetical protein
LDIAAIQHALLVFIADAMGKCDHGQKDKQKPTKTMDEVFHRYSPENESGNGGKHRQKFFDLKRWGEVDAESRPKRWREVLVD